MNEKERIIELVRQNVISMEEALTLLEASAKKEVETKPGNEDIEKRIDHQDKKLNLDSEKIDQIFENILETGANVSQKVADYIKKGLEDSESEKKDYFAEEYQEASQKEEERFFTDNHPAQDLLSETIQDLDEEMADLKEEKEELLEDLVIHKQRLRELEIFAELDDLTDEMKKQESELKVTLSQLEEQVKDLDQELADLHQEKQEALAKLNHKHMDDSKEYIKSKAEDLSKVTSKFADDALKEGKKVTKELGKQLKDIFKNFDMKDVNLSFEVPWIKTYSMDHTFEFEAKDLANIDLKLNNGSVSFEVADTDKVLVEADLRFHGNFENYSLEQFEEMSTISLEGSDLLFHVTSPRLSADLEVKLPARVYNKIKLNLMNGDGSLQGVEVKQLEISNKNGDIHLSEVEGDFINILNFTGDIQMEAMKVLDIVAKTITGDIRLQGNLANLTAETTTGDIFITKKDMQESHIQARATTGDIKISQPKEMNLTIYAATTTGEIYQRLIDVNQADYHKSANKQTLQRLASDQAQSVTIDARLVTGNIWLKDGEGRADEKIDPIQD